MNDFEQETPENDPEIIAIPDIGGADDDVALYLDTEVMSANKSWTGWYKHPRGRVYKICKDQDGYLVHKPGGGKDAWGRGYTWRDVKSAYGLAGVRPYQSKWGTGC